MRIAIIYDCLYPHTVGGVERCYRDLAARLAKAHEVTYVTRRQWRAAERPDAPPGVCVVAVSGGRQLYTASGRRRIDAPLRFGWGVFRHLLRHRRAYDVVHTCGFPFFSLIAARLVRALGGPPVVADWYEVWSRPYWREYLGPIGGRIGAAVQRLCVRLTERAVVFSALHAARLAGEGYVGRPTVFAGGYHGPADGNGHVVARERVVVFVGRHIPEKRVAVIPAAVAAARARVPDLRAIIFGDGPERPRVLAEIERLGLGDVIRCPGFAPWDDVDAALRRAMCLLLPSRREGYGLAILEGAARGAPAIVTRDPDSAAPELIEENENGVVVDGARPEALADAIVAVSADAAGLAERTTAWFARHVRQRTIADAMAQVEALYAEVASGPRRGGRTYAAPRQLEPDVIAPPPLEPS